MYEKLNPPFFKRDSPVPFVVPFSVPFPFLFRSFSVPFRMLSFLLSSLLSMWAASQPSSPIPSDAVVIHVLPEGTVVIDVVPLPN
jgi:hypothetical protein